MLATGLPGRRQTVSGTTNVAVAAGDEADKNYGARSAALFKSRLTLCRVRWFNLFARVHLQRTPRKLRVPILSISGRVTQR